MTMPDSEGAESEGAAAGAEGAAAEAIRAAETALAQQNSVTAQVDLAVVTAVLNAHTAHTDGAAALESLQREIESAVATRTALDTPAGAREFQRYLIDKLGDIRAVVEETDLDDTSKASLAAALASLYASAGSGGAAVDGTGNPATPAPSPPPRSPGSITPPPPGADGEEADPPFAGVIAAAVAGTPIADAFDQQGIAIPGPGTPVSAPLLPEDVVPGDVGLFDDRHALALGNGKVLLDDQIQPIETVNRQGFIGWQHPPEPDRTAEPDR